MFSKDNLFQRINAKAIAMNKLLQAPGFLLITADKTLKQGDIIHNVMWEGEEAMELMMHLSKEDGPFPGLGQRFVKKAMDIIETRLKQEEE